jgi:uncharacterized protein (DUF1697 family)
MVVFIRGVNVGGHKSFRPSLLARQLKDCDVVNIGAAGTWVVRNRISQADFRAELLRRLPFEAEVMICSQNEFLKAIARHPFDQPPSPPNIVRFVSVLSKRPRVPPPLPLRMPADKWLVRVTAIEGRFVFGEYRREMRAIGYLTQVEKRMGMPVTTRNWNTISAITKILNGLAS